MPRKTDEDLQHDAQMRRLENIHAIVLRESIRAETQRKIDRAFRNSPLPRRPGQR